jgi:indolepyruvate ferredoxin oxidoreductase
MGLLMTSLDYRLEAQFAAERGRVVLSGVQALVRAPLDQVRSDAKRGQRTAGLISGYQGSPLSSVEAVYDRNRQLFTDHDIRFNPAVNEELAATMIWGSQQAERNPASTHAGVVGLWFAKGPGLDRAGDAIRHANLAGVSPHSGVLLAVGDDPANKSSSIPSASEGSLTDLAVPFLYPGSIQDVLDFGRFGYEMSRACGAWIGIKMHNDIADGTATVHVDADRLSINHTPFMRDGQPWHPQSDDNVLLHRALELEAEAHQLRPLAAAHFATVNQLHLTVGASQAELGILAAGKAYYDVREALQSFGIISDDDLRDAGISIHKPGLVWPLARDPLLAFTAGITTLLVVEDKRPFLEQQATGILYGQPHQPLIVGKTDEQGLPLIPSAGALEANTLVAPLRRVLSRHLPEERLGRPRERFTVTATEPLLNRAPYFCSGCPHNRSTVVPEGSVAGGGIGCHTMVLTFEDPRGVGVTSMGSEGAQWVGMAPFVHEGHRFQNIGDGTFTHSGSLAIRQAVAAGTNITFKVLYNGTVAMTGGQDAAGALTVPSMTRLLDAEGVTTIVVVRDNDKQYPAHDRFADGVELTDRRHLDEVQRRLRDTPGTSVLIYDQGCAAELRRARKRRLSPTPTTRVVINEAVCDGCGHCGEISNCMSVHPVATPLGRKTRIHQESCNIDLSCLEGECPAFISVTVTDGESVDAPLPDVDLPVPPEPDRPEQASILTVGIGGTGVVTVNQLLTTAALLDGNQADSLDQIGLAQKGGAVVSHLRIGPSLPTGANRISNASADTYLVFDMLAGVAEANLSRAGSGHTVAVVSTSQVPTGQMVANREHEAFPEHTQIRSLIDSATHAEANVWVDAEGLARALFRSQPAANLLLLGVAYQQGLLPVSSQAIDQAIELNGVAVDTNRRAFLAGRVWAVDPERFASFITHESAESAPVPTPEIARLLDRVDGGEVLDEALRWRLPQLLAFGGRPWAERYLDTIERVCEAETAVTSRQDLRLVVAHHLSRVMLYKDEYEVARLHRDPAVLQGIRQRFGPESKVAYQLKPPTLGLVGLDRKIAIGRRTGAVMFATLERFRWLRGRRLDPFGHTEERRRERELIGEYETLVDEILTGLRAERYDDAVALASLIDRVRGFGPVKLANLAQYREELQTARTAWLADSSEN